VRQLSELGSLALGAGCKHSCWGSSEQTEKDAEAARVGMHGKPFGGSPLDIDYAVQV